MDLVEDKIAQVCGRTTGAKDRLVLAANEKVLQHPVAGDKQVRTATPDCFTRPALLGRRLVGPALPVILARIAGVATESDAGPAQISTQAIELIVRERIHRINEQGFNAFPVLPRAIVQNRKEKRLSLS